MELFFRPLHPHHPDEPIRQSREKKENSFPGRNQGASLQRNSQLRRFLQPGIDWI